MAVARVSHGVSSESATWVAIMQAMARLQGEALRRKRHAAFMRSVCVLHVAQTARGLASVADLGTMRKFRHASTVYPLPVAPNSRRVAALPSAALAPASTLPTTHAHPARVRVLSS